MVIFASLIVVGISGKKTTVLTVSEKGGIHAMLLPEITDTIPYLEQWLDVWQLTHQT